MTIEISRFELPIEVVEYRTDEAANLTVASSLSLSCGGIALRIIMLDFMLFLNH